MKTLVTLIVLALLAWGGYALFAGNEPETAGPTDNGGATYLTPAAYQTPNTGTATTTASPTTLPETKSFTVTGTNFAFTPTTMTVNRGDRVKITFQSQGTHDLVVEGYNVRTNILSAGQSQTIEFVANQSGSFEYYCSVGNHRQMGMKGTLVVN
jgi:plastocyanin